MLARGLIIVVLLVALSLAHFLSPPHQIWLHDFWFKVTYLPVVLAGLWFGLRGGVAFGVITGITYAVHIQLQLVGHHQHAQPGFWLELILYLLIGAVVGALTDRQRRYQERLQETNRQLEGSLASLEEKTAALLSAEESLRQADRLRAVGELAAGVAHEVRNPLGGILGAARILADPSTSPQDRAEFGDLLSRETKRLDQVIGRLLELSRPKTARTGYSHLLSEIEFVGRLTAGARAGSRVLYDFSSVPGDLAVAIPSDDLRQILLNLTLNALAAISHGHGRICWTAALEDGFVRVCVTDNGRGVDPAIRPRMFEPFVSGEIGDGTGLGLAIVARLVEEARGRIALESTGPGGTTIAFTLPAGTNRAALGSKPTEEPES